MSAVRLIQPQCPSWLARMSGTGQIRILTLSMLMLLASSCLAFHAVKRTMHAVLGKTAKMDDSEVQN